MAYNESEKHVMKRLDRITDADITQAEMIDIYKEWGPLYDKSILVSKYIGYKVAAEAVKEFCPGKPSNMAVLDVGAGTGLIGKELHDMGFKIIDGIDPSLESIEKAKEKGVYRNLFCEFFTKDQLNLKKDSYDVIVTAGSLLNGHLSYDCLYEMVRLVKPVISRRYPLVAVRTSVDFLGAASPEHYATDKEHSILLSHIILTLSTPVLPLSIIAERQAGGEKSTNFLVLGGIVCIVTRASSFDNKTVPAYVDKLVPLMKDLERNGKWKQKVWETFPEYHKNETGCKIVYEIC